MSENCVTRKGCISSPCPETWPSGHPHYVGQGREILIQDPLPIPVLPESQSRRPETRSLEKEKLLRKISPERLYIPLLPISRSKKKLVIEQQTLKKDVEYIALPAIPFSITKNI